MADVAEIAARLSEAQRRLLTSTLSAEWMDAPSPADNQEAMRGWAGRKIGLLEGDSGPERYRIRLSAKGLAVRDYLANQSESV